MCGGFSSGSQDLESERRAREAREREERKRREEWEKYQRDGAASQKREQVEKEGR